MFRKYNHKPISLLLFLLLLLPTLLHAEQLIYFRQKYRQGELDEYDQENSRYTIFDIERSDDLVTSEIFSRDYHQGNLIWQQYESAVIDLETFTVLEYRHADVPGLSFPLPRNNYAREIVLEHANGEYLLTHNWEDDVSRNYSIRAEEGTFYFHNLVFLLLLNNVELGPETNMICPVVNPRGRHAWKTEFNDLRGLDRDVNQGYTRENVYIRYRDQCSIEIDGSNRDAWLFENGVDGLLGAIASLIIPTNKVYVNRYPPNNVLQLRLIWNASVSEVYTLVDSID